MKSALRLHVITGRHAGATQALDERSFILGSSLEADIVLTDAAVLAKHARITPRGAGVELAAIEGEVRVDGQTIRPGGKIQGRSPLRFALGEAEIEVIAAPASKPLIPPAVTVGGFALLLLLLGGKVYLDMQGGGASLASRSKETSEAGLAKAPAPSQAEMTKAASDALRERLASLSIASISLEPGAGTVRASGTIEPQRKEDWQSAQIWFDENFGQHVVLLSEVAVVSKPPAKAPIAIQSVWHGKFPYLIDADGNKYFEGSVLKGGWVLERIQEDNILLSKDKEPLLLRF